MTMRALSQQWIELLARLRVSALLGVDGSLRKSEPLLWRISWGHILPWFLSGLLCSFLTVTWYVAQPHSTRTLCLTNQGLRPLKLGTTLEPLFFRLRFSHSDKRSTSFVTTQIARSV